MKEKTSQKQVNKLACPSTLMQQIDWIIAKPPTQILCCRKEDNFYGQRCHILILPSPEDHFYYPANLEAHTQVFPKKVCKIINVSASLELVCEDNSCKEKHKGVIVLQMLTLELFLRAKDPLQENLFIYLLQVPAQQQVYQHLHRKQKHSYLMFI